MKNSLNLSKISINHSESKGRIFKENFSQTRSEYQRDRDRVLHSAAFRRLKHKTQVFVSHEGDHYRTRLTHSLEVSQIARSICRIFNLNEDIAETLSIAHDIGHPPFGHAGEEALKKLMSKHDGFDHNDQAIPKSPPIPDHLKTCMKCGSDATTRYSVINQQWFIGCSTFPQCWWKYPLPRDLGNGLIQSMSDARYIKDASHAFTLKGTADELLEAARLCYRVKDKQLLNYVLIQEACG